MTKRTQVRAPRSVFALGLLAAGMMLLFAPEAVAQRRGGGSVRHSSASRTTASRCGDSRTTVTRTTTRGTAARRPAARPAARRPAARPARRGARAGYRAGSRRYDKHYSAWKDARRDYYRYRTINHMIRVGAYVATRPRYTTTVVVSGSTYYYSGGVYYVSSGSGYVVVSSPPGAVVYAVPAHTTVVYVDSTPYYYYGGTYYVVSTQSAPRPTVVVDDSATAVKETYPSYANTEQTPDGAEAAAPELPPMTDDDQSYEVVAPPVGATVPYLPDEADEETVKGKKYFVFEGTFYRPFSSDGDTVYMVVEDPRQS